MKTTKIVAAITLTAGLGVLASSSGASATPATPAPNNLAAGPSVIGTLDGPAKTTHSGIALTVDPDTRVRNFTLTYPAGATSGWHQHPGIVLAVVEQGTVKREVDCHYELFSVGEAFTEAAPHQVSNPGAEPAVLKITQLYPASYTDLSKLRDDKPAPKCR